MRKEGFESSAVGGYPQNELEDSKESLLVVVMGKKWKTLKQKNHQLDVINDSDIYSILLLYHGVLL